MEAETLPVLKVEITGRVTSFRYPHFTQGVQPSFEMPPPSTIYGHICSAVGDWLPPDLLEAVRFGYHFTHNGKFVDFKEHLHFRDPIQPFPFDRELLFNPHLTLYLTEPEFFEPFFKTPRFPVVLGRSQDLMTYRSIKTIFLEKVDAGYFEHTLLPLEMAARLGVGTIAVTMARYIDPRRRPAWDAYALLTEGAALYPPEETPDPYEESLIFEGDEETELWVDPHTPPHRKYPDRKRLVWLHKFVED